MFNHGSREAVQSDRNLPSTAVFSEIAQSCMWYSELCSASPCLDCLPERRCSYRFPKPHFPQPRVTQHNAWKMDNVCFVTSQAARKKQLASQSNSTCTTCFGRNPGCGHVQARPLQTLQRVVKRAVLKAQSFLLRPGCLGGRADQVLRTCRTA